VIERALRWGGNREEEEGFTRLGPRGFEERKERLGEQEVFSPSISK